MEKRLYSFKENVYWVQKISAARVPKQAHNGSAGYDVWSAEKVILKPWNQEFVLIGLKVAIPEAYSGRVVRRSGIA